MTHITDYGGAIDDYYPARIERIADMELTELEKRADIEAEKSRMKPEVLDPMIRTIEQASGIQVQGDLVAESTDGNALIRTNGKLYSGKLIPKQRKEEKE